MKIGLQTWGTDGDFMPFLALAIGLKNAGHEVMLAYTSVDGKDYSGRNDVDGIELIRSNGNVVLSGNFNPYSIEAKAGSFREYSELLERWFEPFTETMFEASSELCQKCDLVVGHAACHTLLTASIKFNTPRISLVLTPLVLRSKHTSPVGANLGGLINSFVWEVGGFVTTQKWFKASKKLRKLEGLPDIKSLQKELFTSNLLTLVATSEAFVPRQKDWSESVQVTGFLNLPADDEPQALPEDVQTFIKEGNPPVYFTFGSCTQFDLENSTRLMIEAAKLSGKRAVIQSDWDKIEKPVNPNICCVDQLKHVDVFPLCALIVHHGGAGTTQAALLAGKPSVVVAHGFDQTYWAKHIYEQKLGARPILRESVTPSAIAKEIRTVMNSVQINDNAVKIGAKMRREDGVQTAVHLIEKVISN